MIGGVMMKKGHKYIVGIFILIFLTSFNMVIQAEDDVLFSRIDPTGDDYGPGHYRYPQHPVFQNYDGLFDIIEFKVLELEKKYEFQFKFTKLVDVWNSRYGFSLPLIEIYIDNEKGGSTELLEKGANVRLNPEYPWNKLLTINGWWISLYSPDDREKDVVDFSVTGDDVPWVIKNPEISVEENRIKLKIEKDKIGSLKNAYLYILVGGFDPFGYGHYREVRGEVNTWFFSTEGKANSEYAPRVIDLIVPPENSQTELLSDYEEDYPQVEPVYTGDKKGFIKSGYYIYLILLLLLSLIVYVFEKIIIKRSGVKEDAEKEQESD